MTQYVQNVFKRSKAIIPITLASTVATFISSTDHGANFDISIIGSVDGVLCTPLSTTPTSTNTFTLNSDVTIDLKVESKLALISASSIASYQAIVWEG